VTRILFVPPQIKLTAEEAAALAGAVQASEVQGERYGAHAFAACHNNQPRE
jgi:hypothetical protein